MKAPSIVKLNIDPIVFQVEQRYILYLLFETLLFSFIAPLVFFYFRFHFWLLGIRLTSPPGMIHFIH